MHDLVSSLRKAGFHAELREPEADDPLAGAIDVTAPFGLMQIISFAGRFPAIIDDVLRESTLVVREGSPLTWVPLPQLVALKLYAGGFRSKADIVELLSRNPQVDLEEICAVCRKYRLRGLGAVLREIRQR